MKKADLAIIKTREEMVCPYSHLSVWSSAPGLVSLNAALTLCLLL